MERNFEFDIVIVGAGPAGTTAALALRHTGLKIALLDKSKFPRDKVCGDAIGSRAKKVLKEIAPHVFEKLRTLPRKSISRGWRLFTPNQKQVSVNFVNAGYVSTRTDFDNFLVEQIRSQNNLTLIENVFVKTVQTNSKGVEVTLSNGEILKSKIILGCDGAHSVVAKQLANFKVNLTHYSGAVRAYYKNVSGMENEMLEIHLVKNFLPGYFWIFPLNENRCNVGFGMLSRDIQKRKIDLKASMKNIIQNSPSLKERFADSEILGDIEGFGLPLGGLKRKISGEHFMLCGDAASIINPLTGEGIGNAMLSGKLAAEQVLRCFEKNNFLSAEIKNYDEAVYKKLLPELKKNLLLQRTFNRPWLINSIVGLALRFPKLKDAIAKQL